MRRFGYDDPIVILLLYILREEEEIHMPEEFQYIKD